MHLGIDLGTTNSAVAAHIDGRVRVCKSPDGADIFPSVIFHDKRGGKQYGSRAYQRLATSPDNVAAGFKRQMGTSWSFTFAGTETTMTAEECSAEVLRQLTAQAITETGNSDITGVVITTPAAFNQLQLEATKRAAELAGISRVALLQEPVAAAMAALEKSQNKDTQFLVYDLGGGTLDLALVQSSRGNITIIGHEGNNMFGGRDFDRAIDNKWVRPFLADNFVLPDDFQKTDEFRRLNRQARFAAEAAKIQLSAKQEAEISAFEDDLRARDGNGEDIYFRIPVTRADYETLISEKVAESVELARKILKDNGFGGEDMDKIVFIGGPSKTPMVRETVSRELGIPADMSVDPMTAVAIGAAIFCESRDWSDAKESTRKKTRVREVAEGAAEMEMIFPARVSENRAQIRLRPSDATAQKGFKVQMESDEGWASGWMSLAGEVRIDAPVGRDGDNTFRFLVSDANDMPVESAGKEITITRTAASVAAISAMHAVAVKIAMGEGDKAGNTLHTIVEKGSPLPAEGVAPYHAAKDVGGDDGADMLSVELFEQPNAENKTVGEPNLYIGSCIIRSDDLGGAVIREGDDVNIHWRQDESGLISAAVEVPSLGRTFDSHNFYLSEAATNRRVFGGESGEKMVAGMLSAAQKDAKEARDVASEEQKVEIRKLENELAKQKAALKADSDEEAQQGVEGKVREIRQKLFSMRNDPQNNARRLRRDLEKAKEAFNDLRDGADEESVSRFDELAQHAEEAIEHGDEDAEKILEEMHGIMMPMVFSRPEFIAGMFRMLAAEPQNAIDPDLFSEHVKQGTDALENGDFGELREIVGAMMSNRVSGGADIKTVVAGIKAKHQ